MSTRRGIWLWPALGPLIGLLLPLSFLFSLDSQLKFASPRETIALYAILFVVYLLAAVLCAAVLRFVVWLLVLCGVPSRRSTTLLRGLQLIGSAVLCTACLLFFARIWCDTIGISGNGRIWRLATLVMVIGVAGAIIWRLCQNRRRRLLGMGASAGRRLSLLGAFTLLVLAIGALFLPPPSLPNPAVATKGPGLPAAEDGGRRPDILLVTFDAMSAQDLSLYGFARQTSPSLQKFAGTAHVFARAFSNGNFTTPSVSSLLSANRPWKHRVFQLQAFLRGEELRHNPIAALTAAGYETVAITANPAANPRQIRLADSFTSAHADRSQYLRHRLYTALTISTRLDVQNLVGIFPLSYAASALDSIGERLYPEDYRQSPRAQFDEAARFLATRDRSRPLFLWVHVWTPHHFYLPPPPYLYRFEPARELDDFASQSAIPRDYLPAQARMAEIARARYDENIAFADAEFGAFLDGVTANQWLENPIIAVSADHGEAFTHGIIGHGGPALPVPMIHIPLLIHAPGQQDSRVVNTTAEQVDILPTLLDLAGVSYTFASEGRSLRPAMQGAADDDDAFSMWLERESAFSPLRRGQVAIIRWPWKLSFSLDRARPAELYDLSRDPGETRNLRDAHPDLAADLENDSRAALQRAESRAADSRP